MGTIWTIATILIIILLSIRNIGKNNSKNNKNSIPKSSRAYTAPNKNVKKAPNKGNPGKNAAYKKALAESTLHSAVSRKESFNQSMLKDDVNNDWLARQLKEEHLAFKNTSAMFGLKIEHVAQCDAHYIRQFHHSHCGADGIDTASVK